MTKNIRIINFLAELRSSHPNIEHMFLNGSCMNLFCILRTIYPQAVAWYNIDHIITEIDGKFYDITGKVSNKGYMLFTDFYNKRRTSRAFTQMYNYKPSLELS